MSLRGKIVVLFLGLAIVPLLIVAGYGYWQTSKSAREVVVVALDASVNEIAAALQRALVEVERDLDALSSSAATRQLIEDPDLAEEWASEVAGRLEPFSYLAVYVPGRGRIAQAGTRPDSTWRCAGGGGAVLHTLWETVKVGETDVQLEAGLWLDDLVDRVPLKVAESIIVFPRGQRTVLLASDCETLKAGVPPPLGRVMGRGGRIRFELGSDERVASFTTLEDRAWSVAAHARTDTFLAPLQQLQATYWVFVLTLALATALAFSLLLGRVVTSLEDLTAAAARIGEGELNPWLPPPGRDEVGRLSLAFSGMLERIRQMMQRVDQSGRLAVVGQLTSYLAHEIRNPLSSIRMNLQSLQREVRRGRIPEESAEAIEISLREVDRLSSSVTSVLQLGRPASGTRETVSVHDVVEDAVDLLAGEFRRRGVRFELELDATADRVSAVTGHLKGVFVNLIMNALEAQPEGGRVRIHSRLVAAPGRGPVVAVRLRDYGGGVPPELRESIFEPFFTTKSQGSGIGLAVALRTIREHGGDVFLAELPETAPGAEFVVELPLAAVAAEVVPEPSIDLPAWMGASESPRGEKTWAGSGNGGARQRPFRSVTDPRIRALMELPDSDHGDLH